jgi:hypothetical protein
MPEATKEERRKAPRVLPEKTRDHLKAGRDEIRQGMEGLFPPEFLDHNRRARKQFLLAARSLIDYALERTEEPRES